jgi:hypothetical protein
MNHGRFAGIGGARFSVAAGRQNNADGLFFGLVHGGFLLRLTNRYEGSAPAERTELTAV